MLIFLISCECLEIISINRMAEITIYRKVVCESTQMERAFYSTSPAEGFSPLVRLVGDFSLDVRNGSTHIIVAGRSYGIGQLSPLRCLGMNLKIFSVDNSNVQYTHGYYLILEVGASEQPAVELTEGNFISSDSADMLRDEEKTIPLSQQETSDFLSRCDNRTDFAVIEVRRSLLPQADAVAQCYDVLLHDRLTLPMTMGG